MNCVNRASARFIEVQEAGSVGFQPFALVLPCIEDRTSAWHTSLESAWGSGDERQAVSVTSTNACRGLVTAVDAKSLLRLKCYRRAFGRCRTVRPGEAVGFGVVAAAGTAVQQIPSARSRDATHHGHTEICAYRSHRARRLLRILEPGLDELVDAADHEHRASP